MLKVEKAARVIPISGKPVKDTIICIGFAKTSRDLVPWDREDCEFWSINERYNWGEFKYEKISRHFQIHPYANFMRQDNRNDPNHPTWMKQKHDFPIYTQEVYSTVPSSVRYPLEEVVEAIGSPYMESSLAIMLGLVIYEYKKYHDIKRVEIYGFDMSSNTEYFHQRHNAEYLIGYMRGIGIDVYVPDICPITKGTIYGYKSITAGFSQNLEYRTAILEDQAHLAHYDFHYARGRYELAKEVMSGTVITPEITAQLLETTKQCNRKINQVLGALNENKLIRRAYGDFLENGGNVHEISWEEDAPAESKEEVSNAPTSEPQKA